jgi:hypothetical protein
MAILRFPFSPSEPCIFDIFKPINLKFGILMKNYITTNDTIGFFDKLSINYGIELELGPSRIKGFFFNFFRHFVFFALIYFFYDFYLHFLQTVAVNYKNEFSQTAIKLLALDFRLNTPCTAL